MGWWSRVKSAVKKVVRVVKTVVRQVVRVVVEAVGRTIGIGDLLLGFITWPRKKLRLHVAVLSDEPIDIGLQPLVTEADLIPALDYIKRVFHERFNVRVVPYSKSFVQVIEERAPAAALEIDCGGGLWLADFGDAGDFFARHLAGWNAIPVSVTFPVTVYVVREVRDGKQGCSLGPLTDYVVIDLDGVRNETLMAHEVAHACGLWHSKTRSNLMYAPADRGDGAKWFQKNLLRSSRHVQYW